MCLSMIQSKGRTELPAGKYIMHELLPVNQSTPELTTSDASIEDELLFYSLMEILVACYIHFCE